MLNVSSKPIRIVSDARAWLTFFMCLAVSLPNITLAAGVKMPDEIVYPSAVGEVRFPHRAHVKMKCVSCHHQIHAAALETPHDGYLDSSWIHCRTCHDSDPELTGKYYKCSECHRSTPANIADETLSAKVVIHESCWQCHKAGTGVKASESCGECHVKEVLAETALQGGEGDDPQSAPN